MKQPRLLLAILTCIIFSALLISPFYSTEAAQKKGFENLKYPELNPLKLPEVEKTVMSNGMKIRLIKDDKLPLVEISIVLGGGRIYQPSEKVGLMSIMTQLLTIGGTKDLKPGEMDKLLDSKGISVSAYSSSDQFEVSMSCLKENLDEGLSILSKIVREPAFNEEKLEEIKTQSASEISRRNENPDDINDREFTKLIYGSNSPLAAVQEYEHLDNIVRDDILKVHQFFFSPDNMLVGVTGPLELTELKGLFEKYFGDWTKKTQVPSFKGVQEQKYDFKVAVADKPDLNQSYFSLGHLSLPVDKNDMAEQAKIKVFNSIFSQGFGSRLVTRIRVKMGLTYGVSGGVYFDYLYPGVTSFSTYTKSESTLDAINAMKEEIDLIRKEKVTEKELEDAKNYFLNSYVFEFRSPSQILNKSLTREFYGIDADSQQKLIENIKKVTADDILQIAQKYLQPDKMVLFVVCNEKGLKGNLSDLGPVKKIDISIKPQAIKEIIPPATPQTLEQGKKIFEAVLKKNFAGYKTLKSMTMQAENTIVTPQGELMMSTKSTQLLPDKNHVFASVMGMNIERIINGTKGISRQMGQERPITQEEIEKDKFGDLYYMYLEKDKYQFQYLKEEEIDGKKYDVIYITDINKNWAKFFVNKTTLLVDIEEKLSNLPWLSGLSRTVNTEYKEVNGISIPHKLETTVNGKKATQMIIKEVKINVPVDSALFSLEAK